MIKKPLITVLITCLAFCALFAQSGGQLQNSREKDQNKFTIGPVFKDSVITQVHASYNNVSGIHKWLFGTNYRKEWAMPTKLPVLYLSQWHGGLTPVKQGGGMESKSLRLVDKTGQEWVLRSVEKTPDKLLPENLQGTFAVDWVGDEFSAQHPYSALVVPPLAEAANVPHANPTIGVVADDPALGEYRKLFKGMICLLEEREPTGPSDNTIKMESSLIKSYDSRFDGRLFLRARLLDLLIGDWDRHEDQWRWAGTKEGKEKDYQPVPRDRDQVFHINQGVFPSIAALPWIDPVLGNFDGALRMKYNIFKTRFMGAFPDAQMSYQEWMKVVDEFVKAETDEVLEKGLKRLPFESYQYRHKELLRLLKQHRAAIPRMMSDYYYFINRIVDIRITDGAEEVVVTNAPENAMRIIIKKSPGDETEPGKILWDLIYNPIFTKEIRFYLQGGDDHIHVDSKSPIRLRMIDSSGRKTFDVQSAYRKIQIYAKKDSDQYTSGHDRIKTYYSSDSTFTRFRPVNLYNVWTPLATAAINADDGFLLGLGFRYTGQDGFHKEPYGTLQELVVTHAFATEAFRLRYHGEWIKAAGQADIVTDAIVQAPDNTMNFFGLGNETIFAKSGDYHRFYRARFDIYQFDPALRWKTGKGSTFSAGPSFQFYHLNGSDNAGRYIIQPGSLNNYESETLTSDKAHVGLKIGYTSNQRNNNMLPAGGYYLDVTVAGYKGLNNDSKTYGRLNAEFTYYQKADSAGRLVFSDRIGGGLSAGNLAFYQSMFLGGQGNLLGYLQNRFAGRHMAYNNFQARYKLANIASYILPGQLGVTGFYDIGRVWLQNEHSDHWHQGTGGGLYFSPASLTVIQVLAGHSVEGWYPYISLNFRL